MERSRLNAAFKEKEFDAIISEAPQTRLWYAKVQTSDGWLIIEPKKATLFVDGRYYEYAKNNAKNVDVKLLANDELKKFLEKKAFKKIAIEEDYLNLMQKNRIKAMTELTDDQIVLIKGQDLRIIKTDEEIAKLQKAINISLDALESVKSYLKEGITEKEIDHKLNYLMKRLGADKEGFDNIVAFGKNTAMPHHHPTENKLVNGDIVTIDFGAQYQGYTADITRTFIFKTKDTEPNVDPKLTEILTVVEEAAQKGRDAIKPGIKASEIDKICRDYIKEKGYGNFFVHSTGHGIGIDVHEFPRVSHLDETILEPGMVITVEPGIYIESVGGARIEDDVLVTKDGHQVLSRKQEKND